MTDVNGEFFNITDPNLVSTNSELGVFNWIFGLFLVVILSLSVRSCYRRYSTSISNLTQFTKIFVPFAVGVFLIISTIKASLALSLGLVGALSIVRFRTAVKEPEQLIYLFLLIGISISAAANQYFPAIIVTLVFYVISHIQREKAFAFITDTVNLQIKHDKTFATSDFLKSLTSQDGVEVERIITSPVNTSVSLAVNEFKIETMDSIKELIAQYNADDYSLTGYSKPID